MLACALAVTGTAVAETAYDQIEETYAFAAGSRLSVTNTNGDIYIEPWDRDEALIVAKKKVKTRRGDAEEALEELRVEIDVDGSGIEIDTYYPSWKKLFGWSEVSASVDYDIKVPRRADLDVKTTNGEVEIEGIEGRIRLRSTNGGLSVSDAAGSVSAGTTNGGIQVELDQVDAGSEMDFETTNGGIRLYLPSQIQASVSARTTNGTIETDFPVAVQGTFRRNRLEGEINGGGPLLELRTTNGSIRILER
jgi:DUF4097 and DUF4098 domain-containing protein YvlB